MGACVWFLLNTKVEKAASVGVWTVNKRQCIACKHTKMHASFQSHIWKFVGHGFALLCACSSRSETPLRSCEGTGIKQRLTKINVKWNVTSFVQIGKNNPGQAACSQAACSKLPKIEMRKKIPEHCTKWSSHLRVRRLRGLPLCAFPFACIHPSVFPSIHLCWLSVVLHKRWWLATEMAAPETNTCGICSC